MWDDPRQMNALATGLVVLAVGLLAWGAVAWLVRQPAFAFQEVVVRTPLQRANAAHVEAVVRDELSGTFFTMNLDRSRAALARVPWVRKVALRRQWPQRLEVEIEEHAPLARWNDAALVNAEGEVFVADYDGELPLFVGARRPFARDRRALSRVGRGTGAARARHPRARPVAARRMAPHGERCRQPADDRNRPRRAGGAAFAVHRHVWTDDRRARAGRHEDRARGSALSQRLRGAGPGIQGTPAEEDDMSMRGLARSAGAQVTQSRNRRRRRSAKGSASAKGMVNGW